MYKVNRYRVFCVKMVKTCQSTYLLLSPYILLLFDLLLCMVGGYYRLVLCNCNNTDSRGCWTAVSSSREKRLVAGSGYYVCIWS